MTDEQSDSAVGGDEAEDTETGFTSEPEAGDWFLRSLVDLTNKARIELPLTLTVEGFLVSGLLISGAVYFEETAKQFSGDSEASIGNQLGQLIGSFAGFYSEDGPVGPVAYLHLRNARMFHNSGKPVPVDMGVLWRGRISQVAGFSFGTLSVEE